MNDQTVLEAQQKEAYVRTLATAILHSEYADEIIRLLEECFTEDQIESFKSSSIESTRIVNGMNERMRAYRESRTTETKDTPHE